MSSAHFEVFAGISPVIIADRMRSILSQTFNPGEVVLREGEPNTRLFLIEAGEVEVWKGVPRTPAGVRIAHLSAGNCFGEMSAINASASSATVIASAPSTLRIMTAADLQQDEGIREQVTLNLARLLVQRLTHANRSIQEKHERELTAMRSLAAASGFITRILIALVCYMFCLPLIALLTPLIPSDSLISFFFIVVFGWVVLRFIIAWPDVRDRYFHMTLEHWPRQLARGLLWSIPPLIVFVIIKLAVMQAQPGRFEFFEPMAAISRGAPMNYPLWLAFASIYAGLTFAQEFIRCSIQGTLDMIYGSPETRYWKAIIVSDIVFASIHLHLSPFFAIQAFIAGLFFGYQFWRERSYLSVAVAHSVLGVFAVFIAGVPR